MDLKREENGDAPPPEQIVDPLTQDTAVIPSSNEAQSIPTQSFQTSVQQITNQALHFLSTASNETLGACLVGLGATTYLVLGRVGLVLIGAVGGVVLHATWEGSLHQTDKSVEERRKKEVGLEVVQRVLDWRTKSKETAVEEDEDEETSTKVEVYSKKKLDFDGFRPETQAALIEFTDAIIRDYVRWWYSPIIPTEMAFPAACQQTLTAFLLSLSTHLSRKRPADTFLDFLTNSSSIVIVFLNELSSAIAASPNSSCADAVQTYLEMKPDSNLAHVLDTKHQQKKLDLVAQDILECYLEHKSYNCEPVRVFCQQIISQVIMEMTINSCSEPEFINGWIVYLLEDGEPELLKDVDAGLDGIVPGAAGIADSVEPNGGNDKESAQHKRTLSRAQEAMDDAMQEAQRLSQLIAEDDARRQREGQTEEAPPELPARPTKPEPTSPPSTGKITPSASSIMTDEASESTTQGVATPTSSQSEAHGEEENRSSQEDASRAEQLEQDETNSLSEDNAAPFTSFDQLIPHHATALAGTPKKEIPPLTLHNASIVIFDDTDPNDRSSLRKKPESDYLLQIEPASSHYPGWMIVRKYADFETIHEVLRRIAAISGAGSFVQAHATLPNFKVHTRFSLREALERYLSDATHHKALAESEGMKRFLEKERGLEKSPGPKSGFGWPGPNMGKGMIDALAKAPKDVASGGKAFVGGVTGVLGNKKKQSISSPSLNRTSISSPPGPSRIQSNLSSTSQTSLPRKSQDSLRNMSPVVDTQPAPVAQMNKPEPEAEIKPRASSSNNSRATSVRESMEQISVLGGDQILQLPPPPSDIPDDYNPLATSTTNTKSPIQKRSQQPDQETPIRTSTSTTSSSLDLIKPSSQREKVEKPLPIPKPKPSITEQETQVAVELLFATIQELYTLSSAWTLRRTLLTAAKTFLLRPGNPQLESIRLLLQSTVLDANTSDSGIATHLRKLRENALPTDEELKAWPPALTAKESEDLRMKARKLLVERGMPQALTSVMGQAASGEALGKVFDCLQVQSVARGLIFGLILQGMRAVTQ
ncbi:hypothetical protein EJ08DRAFT_489938 [Tothia fuscella]|uniref:PXA domain-containing protein n=1 Tax=Tothia fuscella TaxID=1048955 RepID=A0A9P4TT71_9PEZI|nr:hypothetical protein EJ08DRAFT_489938 [Tothia fuscella]